MAIPTLISVAPVDGPASGGDLVCLVGTGFAQRVAVAFGGQPAAVLAVRDEAGSSVVDVRTPAHEAAAVDVILQNLDASGTPIPGEVATIPTAYRFLRSRVAAESHLTRLVRQLLRELKRQVLANVSTTVSVDYDDSPGSGIIAMATVPSVVLSGPSLRQNRFYSSNVALEELTQSPSGPEFTRRRPAFTVDLLFTITVTSSRTAELLNLMAALATFLNRNRWIALDRDPSDPSAGRVRWEMDADGEVRTQLENKSDVRAFSWALVIRGFDIDEGLLLDRAPPVEDADVRSLPLKEIQ
jgi:hypothetical protein